jgi:hypothetical protein
MKQQPQRECGFSISFQFTPNEQEIDADAPDLANRRNRLCHGSILSWFCLIAVNLSSAKTDHLPLFVCRINVFWKGPDIRKLDLSVLLLVEFAVA